MRQVTPPGSSADSNTLRRAGATDRNEEVCKPSWPVLLYDERAFLVCDRPREEDVMVTEHLEGKDALIERIQLLHAQLLHQLPQLPTDTLYTHPDPQEWSIMENLAHIGEFYTYWGSEVRKLQQQPGCSFGRTIEDERRLAGIRDHANDTIAQIEQHLRASFAELMDTLNALSDADLQKVGHHHRLGDQTMAFYIKHFLIEHLSDHLAQLGIARDRALASRQ